MSDGYSEDFPDDNMMDHSVDTKPERQRPSTAKTAPVKKNVTFSGGNKGLNKDL